MPPPKLDQGALPPADQAAEFKAWVDAFYSDVYRYAYRLVGEASGAEDVVQQTFLQAWAHREQVDSQQAVRGWLLAIARNTFLKSLRRERPASFSKLGVDADSLSEVSYGTSHEEVAELLAQLPEEQRTLLLMFYFEGLAYREIAERLDLPVGTVMSRLHRAKQSLKRIDGEEDE